MDLQPPTLRRRSTTFNEFITRRNLLEEPNTFVFHSVNRNLLNEFNQYADENLLIGQIEEQIDIIIEEILGDISDYEDNSDIEEEMDYEYDTDDNIDTEIRPWEVDEE